MYWGLWPLSVFEAGYKGGGVVNVLVVLWLAYRLVSNVVKQARINGLSLVTGLANFRHCLVICYIFFLLTRWGGILVIWLALYLGGMG